MNDSKLKNPFELNEMSQYIACVGWNGGTYNEDILSGFEKTVDLIVNDIVNNHGEEDTLIYPLVYSCRHSIELTLKIICYSILKIQKIKKIYNVDLLKRIYTHDIEELNLLVQEIYEIDKRIPPLYTPMIQYLKAYYFDTEGDVFKYEKDKKEKFHLEKLGIEQISITDLYHQFKAYTELAHRLINELEYYISEYSTGTFFKTLSREDLKQISIDCPDYKNWDKEMKPFKTLTLNKYSISGKTFDGAINIIKDHLEFAANVGIEHKYKSLKNKAIESYIKYVGALDIKPSNGFIIAGDFDWDVFQNEMQVQTTIISNALLDITHNELVLLNTFFDIGKFNDIYIENIEITYNTFLEGSHISDYLLRRIKSYSACNYVLSGMLRCGQTTYAKIMEKYLLENKIDLKEIEKDGSNDLVLDFD